VTHPNPRPVVVGTEGTALSRTALVAALEEGAAHEVPVRVVSAWTFGTVLHDADDSATEESQTRIVLAEIEASVADAQSRTGARPEVEPVAVHGTPGESLVEAARDARVLVVGTGRKSILSRALLGSTSEYCVRHSPVPVLVVPSSE
jgi:nucleotide-binding universal stress UspA family protein